MNIELKMKTDKAQYTREIKGLVDMIKSLRIQLNNTREELLATKEKSEKFRKERDQALRANLYLEGKILDQKQ